MELLTKTLAPSLKIGFAPALAAAGLALAAGPAAQAQVTNYTDRPTFNAAVNPTVLEDFTSTDHLSIPGGTLNSQSNYPAIGITPGTIQPGVTYSVPVANPGLYQFNIDGGGGFVGGFLDSLGTTVGGPALPLTVTFDKAATGFGFDTDSLMGSSFTVNFNLADGTSTSQTFNVANTGTLQFFGFSDPIGITSASITGSDVGSTTGSRFGFALDNFAFNNNGAPVPEASTTVSFALLLALGLGGVVLAARTRVKT